jgi:hypothetical protein
MPLILPVRRYTLAGWKGAEKEKKLKIPFRELRGNKV